MNAMLSRPPSSWRRFTIALIAVPAILVGLLAMHFLASESFSPDTHSVSASASDSMTPLAAHNEMPVPADCTDMCVPTDDMLGMACVLALLVTAVLLVFRVFRVQFRTVSEVAWVQVTRLSTLAPPIPPSLHVLSISRT